MKLKNFAMAKLSIVQNTTMHQSTNRRHKTIQFLAPFCVYIGEKWWTFAELVTVVNGKAHKDLRQGKIQSKVRELE